MRKLQLQADNKTITSAVDRFIERHRQIENSNSLELTIHAEQRVTVANYGDFLVSFLSSNNLE